MTATRWLSAVWHILTASPHLEASQAESRSFDFVPDAVMQSYLESHPAPVAADSPSLALGSAPPKGASLLVPLVSQGRLVGLLTLGTPYASKAYSAEELAFVATLADEAAAAARIAQLRPVTRVAKEGRRHRPGSELPADDVAWASGHNLA